MDFWRAPEGVSVPDDELRFLLVPDAVEAAAVSDVAGQVQAYQQLNDATPEQIGCALIVTMGGMLPGILLHDHLVHGAAPGLPRIDFGTVGVSLYREPGVRYDTPRIAQAISTPVHGRTVLLIDDLLDTGATVKFLRQHLQGAGAHHTLVLALYVKPAAKAGGGAEFFFGELDQDTWIITPREQVETLVKRVPVWRERGASEAECRHRLVATIGYPEALVDTYLPRAFGLPRSG